MFCLRLKRIHLCLFAYSWNSKQTTLKTSTSGRFEYFYSRSHRKYITALFLIRFNPLHQLLTQLASVSRACFTAPLSDTLLDVRFLGDRSEYNVVENVIKIARQKAETESAYLHHLAVITTICFEGK